MINIEAEMFFKKRTRSKKILLTLIIMGMLSALYYISWWFDGGRFFNPYLSALLFIACFYIGAQGIFVWYIYLNVRSEWKYQHHTPFTVDVFLPVYNEPAWLVEKTIKAATANTYPHTTYILDDGHKSEYKDLANKYGAIYLTRPENKDNKAGNVNHALKYSHGDIIAIFDVDHAPEPNFIERAITYFENPKVGVVQTTLDHFNDKESFVANACAKMNDDFFGPTMLGMAGSGSAVIFGSNSVFRRKALESLGGYKPGLAEDLSTSMHLHAAGWKSVYHPEILAKGLVPADLPAFFKQQLKWAKGVFTVFTSVYPKLFTKLSFNQHISYLTRMTYYLAGPVILGHIIASAFALTIPRIGYHFAEYLTHSMPFILMFFVIHQYAGKKYYVKKVEDDAHIEGVLLMLGAWPIYCIALFTHLIGAKIPFIATPKEVSQKNNFKLIIPHVIVSAMFAFLITRTLLDGINSVTVINSLFALGLILINAGVFYAYIEENKIRKVLAEKNSSDEEHDCKESEPAAISGYSRQ